MPDFSTPATVGDFLDGGMPFQTEELDEELRLKCNYHFLHSRVQIKQRQDEDVSTELMETMNDLEQKLMDAGIRPSSLLEEHK